MSSSGSTLQWSRGINGISATNVKGTVGAHSTVSRRVNEQQIILCHPLGLRDIQPLRRRNPLLGIYLLLSYMLDPAVEDGDPHHRQ
jgi:hypothetical protein